MLAVLAGVVAVAVGAVAVGAVVVVEPVHRPVVASPLLSI